MTRLAAPFLVQFARPADAPPPVRYVADDDGLLRRTDADRPDPDIVRDAHGRTARLAAGLGTDIVTVAPDPDVIRFAIPRGR